MTGPLPRGVTRREIVGGAAAFGLGFGLDHVLAHPSATADKRMSHSATAPFWGPHQAGILSPAPDFVNFAAYDLSSESVEDLRRLLQTWTEAAAQLTAGKPVEGLSEGVTPEDTGEAEGLGPGELTITFGFGPSLFARSGGGMSALARQRPPRLSPLPNFKGENLDPARSDGDLCVQACGQDPQVVFHAFHMITRLAEGVATLRWSQQGFGRTSSTTKGQATPRNLMGFKDGTANIRAEEMNAVERYVWARAADGCGWMEGGTYAVVRRIQILFDVWDALPVGDQERTVGRKKKSGAPLGKSSEYDPIDLSATVDGRPIIPVDAHVRLASPQANNGERLLRRGYSYVEPPEPGSGSIDAGLLFICFQRDPAAQFVRIQRRLAARDALARHIQHNASALFAVPPGVKAGSFIGEGLFGASA